MKLEAVVVTEAVAEEEESRRAFAKIVHITALHANTKPTQPMRSSTGSCRMKWKNPCIFTDQSFTLTNSWALWSKTQPRGLLKLNYSWYYMKMNILNHRRKQKQGNSPGRSVTLARPAMSPR